MRYLWRLLGFRRPRYHFWFGLAFLLPVSAVAQVAPGVFTTVKSTSTAATSVCVGCPVGTTTPAANSGITAATVVLPSGVPSSTTNKLYSSAGALFFNGLAIATGGSINGTTNTVSKFTAATVLGDSIITDSGTQVTVAGAFLANGANGTGTNGVAGAFILNGPAASVRSIVWRTAGVARWFENANATAETGANAGTDYQLQAYNDAGSLIGNAISVTRSTMAVTLGQNLTVTGTTALSGATTVATSLQLTGGAPVYLANATNGYLFRNAANGATLLSITDAGVAAFSGALTAASYAGSGAGLTLVPAGQLTGSCCGAATNVQELDDLTANTAFGTHTWTGSSNGIMRHTVDNNTSGTAALAGFRADAGTNITIFNSYSQGYTTSGFAIAAGATIENTGAGGIHLALSNAAGVIDFWTNSTLRWGVNAAGDWTFGASARIADSNGTPTINTGFGTSPTIGGTDYAILVTTGTGAQTGGTVTFGHGTFSAAPVCTQANDLPLASVILTTSTSSVAISYTSTSTAGIKIMILCRGY